MMTAVPSKRVLAKVVVFHDFDHRKATILDLFRISEETACEVRYVAQQMCDDLLSDVAELRRELDEIEAFAKRELQRPYPNG
jgi:hypothetical protein